MQPWAPIPDIKGPNRIGLIDPLANIGKPAIIEHARLITKKLYKESSWNYTKIAPPLAASSVFAILFYFIIF